MAQDSNDCKLHKCTGIADDMAFQRAAALWACHSCYGVTSGHSAQRIFKVPKLIGACV